MKIDFDSVFKTMEGKDIPKVEGKEEPFTLKDVCLSALMANFDDEKNLTGKDKIERYAIACKIRTGGECDLVVEDITLLKNLVGKLFGVLVVGQAYPMLEGKEVK